MEVSRLRAYAGWLFIVVLAGCSPQRDYTEDLMGGVLLGTSEQLESTGSATTVAVGNWRGGERRLSIRTDEQGRADDLLELRSPEGELVMQLLFSHGRPVASWSRWDAEHGNLTSAQLDSSNTID